MLKVMQGLKEMRQTAKIKNTQVNDTNKTYEVNKHFQGIISIPNIAFYVNTASYFIKSRFFRAKMAIYISLLGLNCRAI